jgi:hypothetical protein
VNTSVSTAIATLAAAAEGAAFDATAATTNTAAYPANAAVVVVAHEPTPRCSLGVASSSLASLSASPAFATPVTAATAAA